MAFCTKCGTQLEAGAAFCGDCGAAATATGTPGTKSPGIQQEERVQGRSRESALLFFALSALFALFALFLVINPESWSDHMPPILAALLPEGDKATATMICGILTLLFFGSTGVVFARQAFASRTSPASPKDQDLPLTLPRASHDSSSQRSETSQDASLSVNAPQTRTAISSFERLTSSWITRALVIVLTLAGVGIHYSYTQRHRQALINTVRNSHMPEFPNVSVGQALESNFQNYEWTTFKNPDKSIAVGFVGYQTFQDAMGGPGNPGMLNCSKRASCFAILKKISDSCSSSPSEQGPPSSEQISCVGEGIQSNANTLIPVHFQFAANDQDGSVSLIKTDLVPD